MKIRPEAERRLRAGFQRRVDAQRQRYAVQLAHAGQLAVRFECGEVAGVFSGEAGIGRRTPGPNTIGTTRPAFPTIDQIIAAYAGRPAPDA